MNSKSRFFSSFNFSILAQIAVKFLGFAFSFLGFVLAARCLGPNSLGELNFAFSLIALLAPIGGLGSINSLRALSISQNNLTGLTESAFCIQLVGSIFLLIIILPIAIALDNIALLILILVGLAINFISSFNVLEVNIISGFKGQKIALLSFFQALLGLFFSVILYISNTCSIFTFALVPFFTTIFRSIYLVKLSPAFELRKIISRVNKRAVQLLLSRGWLLLISFLSISTYSKVDKIMIGLFMTQYDVGIYSTADQILSTLSSIFAVITMSYYPKLVNTFKAKSDELIDANSGQELFKLMLALAITLSLLSATLIPFSLAHIFGTAYEESSKILIYLSPSLLFIAINYYTSAMLNIQGSINTIAVSSIITASLNIILNCMLIPEYGLNGAIVASIVALIFGFGYRCYKIKALNLLCI